MTWFDALVLYPCAIIGACMTLGFVGDWLRISQYWLLHPLGGRVSYLVIERFTLPGVVVHELSHALLAWLLGAKVGRVKFIHWFDADTLGSCEIYPRGVAPLRGVQMFFASVAPTVVGCGLLALMWHGWLHSATPVWGWPVVVYLTWSLVNHVGMSEADRVLMMRGIIPGYLGCAMLGIAALSLR